jgi:hypothetical protein
VNATELNETADVEVVVTDAHACDGCLPCVRRHLKAAVEMRDAAEMLNQRAHHLLSPGADEDDVCEASGLLLDAGRLRVNAWAKVRAAWFAVRSTEGERMQPPRSELSPSTTTAG